MPKMLKVGDTVQWAGAWGTQPAKVARVTEIDETRIPGDKYGTAVTKLSWSLVQKNYAVVTLDNGHWAYGYQLSPV